MQTTLFVSLLFPVGVPECSDVAFVNEDKFLACPLSSISTVPGCEGYSASSAQSLGGTILWCILTASNTPFCVTNDNFTSAHSLDLPLLNISGTGVLHISTVTVALRGTFTARSGAVANNNVANCSIFNQQDQLCGKARLELFIHLIGNACLKYSSCRSSERERRIE